MSIHWGRYSVVVLIVSALASCNRTAAIATHDAGRQWAAPQRVIPPRAAAPGELALDVAKSKISFSVIKDRDVTSPVVVSLTLRDGAVALGASPASARLSIDLDSVDSGIPLRNERIRGIFFETSAIGWETAELSIPVIPEAAVESLRTKHLASHVKLDATLKIHGRTAPIVLDVDAGYEPDGRLWIRSAGQAQVKIADFGLIDNLRRLSSICMHDSIDDTVNVTAALEFAAP